MDYICNAQGTSRWSTPSTGESSWLEYWKNHKSAVGVCRCGNCGTTSNLVGAHVQKVFGGNELYITPLCSGCNRKTDEFLVDTELVRVPSGL